MATNRVLPSKKITKRSVDALKCPENRDRIFLWDEELNGFGVAAFRGGKKTYFIQYRQHGRTRRYAIGEHGTLTPDEAREKARRDLAAVAKGEDPIDTRRKEREVPTFEKASGDFMAAFKRQIDAGEKKGNHLQGVQDHSRRAYPPADRPAPPRRRDRHRRQAVAPEFWRRKNTPPTRRSHSYPQYGIGRLKKNSALPSRTIPPLK